ncbi:MAG: TatD family hydrolase [Kiritimatiellia bacterium]|nr:TatD family hydrolase [Kiritimatiellia bacterium]
MWTDTHAHFDELEETGATAAALERATAAGVTRCIAIGGSPEANERALQVAIRFPDQVRATAGFDRHLAPTPPDFDLLRPLLERPDVVAVGECGLDYSRGTEEAAAQRALFGRMLECARTARLPVVVHSRMADADTLAMLREHVSDAALPPPGILHCYTGDATFADALLELGWWISFSGILTFRNADPLRQVARRIPLDRILLETDTPYLAPVPMRGRVNEPAYLPNTGQLLADLFGQTPEEMARTTSHNADRAFRLSTSGFPMGNSR